MCEFHTLVKKTSKNLIGPTIKKIRVSLRPKVSQQDLAGRLATRGIQIDRSAIARIEAGARFARDFEIIGIAAALRVPLERLFAGQ
jgi:transcriptional regulator with XRE-family HTH domain